MNKKFLIGVGLSIFAITLLSIGSVGGYFLYKELTKDNVKELDKMFKAEGIKSSISSKDYKVDDKLNEGEIAEAIALNQEAFDPINTFRIQDYFVQVQHDVSKINEFTYSATKKPVALIYNFETKKLSIWDLESKIALMSQENVEINISDTFKSQDDIFKPANANTSEFFYPADFNRDQILDFQVQKNVSKKNTLFYNDYYFFLSNESKFENVDVQTNVVWNPLTSDFVEFDKNDSSALAGETAVKRYHLDGTTFVHYKSYYVKNGVVRSIRQNFGDGFVNVSESSNNFTSYFPFLSFEFIEGQPLKIYSLTSEQKQYYYFVSNNCIECSIAISPNERFMYGFLEDVTDNSQLVLFDMITTSNTSVINLHGIEYKKSDALRIAFIDSNTIMLANDTTGKKYTNKIIGTGVKSEGWKEVTDLDEDLLLYFDMQTAKKYTEVDYQKLINNLIERNTLKN